MDDPRAEGSRRRSASGPALALVAVGAAVFMAVACTTPRPDLAPSYEQHLSRWEGDSEANLVTAWGVPAKTHVLAGGGRIIEYSRVGEGEKAIACTTRFTLNDQGKIVRWWFRGHECLAPVSE